MKIFTDIKELITLEGAAKKDGRHVKEEDLSLIKDAAIVSENGKIKWVGPKSQLKHTGETISFGNQNVMPAFTECHTHLIFAGNRAHEFEWRMQGQTYKEISAKGGGIRYTVNETRKASEQQLQDLAQKRADRFVSQGVTTLEVKSGYGLDTETEIRSLKVARRIEGPRIITTYLGAHSASPDHKSLDEYLNKIEQEIMPRIAKEKLADRVDIYIEGGFFTPEHAKRYFRAAQALHLHVTAHVEQLSDTQGTDTTVEFAPQSVDHLVFISDQTIQKLVKSQITAVLLPASDFYLKMQYPRARKLIDDGARVALSTDFNPGTSPTQDLSLVGVLARLEMKMSLPEVFAAYTLNAAFALGKQAELGSLTIGKDADFVVTSAAWTDFFYNVGEHPITHVYRAGDLLR